MLVDIKCLTFDPPFLKLISILHHFFIQSTPKLHFFYSFSSETGVLAPNILGGGGGSDILGKKIGGS